LAGVPPLKGKVQISIVSSGKRVVVDGLAVSKV
jgi:hypothetical protein